jgi:HEXXH motif-containing protein
MPAFATDLDDLIAPLAAAGGDAQVAGQLIKGQYGKRMLQLRRAVDEPAASAGAEEAGRRRAAYALLARVQREKPEVFRTVLLDPDVGCWLDGRSGRPEAVACVAAAAAIRAGQPATIVVPADDGTIFLPGLGTVGLGGPHGPGHAVVAVADRITVTAGDRRVVLPADLASAAGGWRPVCWISAGQRERITVRLATSGPVHDAFTALYPPTAPHPPAPPHPPTAPHPSGPPASGREQDWQQALSEAWQILEQGYPAHAASIAAGLRAIVPVPPADDGSAVSATLEPAFGAVALSLPSRPELFAVALVHEFQHAKLNAALDLIQFYEPDDRACYYAPWRPDPRPLGALLQGIYAHLGVAGFWGVRGRLAGDRGRRPAQVEFVRWRDDTWQAARDLAGAPTLTEAGREFLDRLLGELERLRGEDVPAEARRMADLIARDHKVSWRLRNLEVDRDAARGLARAWLDGGPPPALASGSVRRRPAPRKVTASRIRLLYRHLDGDLADTADTADTAPVADLRYVRGDYQGAFDAYERRVADDPGDLDAWAGLALSALAGDGACADVLADTPEVVAEVFRQAMALNRELEPPRALARWLSTAA